MSAFYRPLTFEAWCMRSRHARELAALKSGADFIREGREQAASSTRFAMVLVVSLAIYVAAIGAGLLS